jgi:hypothetical protein
MSEEKDGFDIQQPIASGDQSSMPLSSYAPQQGGGILALLQNLSVDNVDKNNLKALTTGFGAAAASKYLSDDINPIVKAMAGAGLAAFVGEKLFGPTGKRARKRRRY